MALKCASFVQHHNSPLLPHLGSLPAAQSFPPKKQAVLPTAEPTPEIIGCLW